MPSADDVEAGLLGAGPHSEAVSTTASGERIGLSWRIESTTLMIATCFHSSF